MFISHQIVYKLMRVEHVILYHLKKQEKPASYYYCQVTIALSISTLFYFFYLFLHFFYLESCR